ENLDAFMGLGLQFGVQRPGILNRTHHQQAPFQIVLAKLALYPAPHHFLLEENQNETDRAKKDNDTTRWLHTGQERDQNDYDGGPGAGPEKLPDGLTPGGEQRAVVKALHRQQQRRDGKDDEDHPGIVLERFDFGALPKELEFPDRAQLV